MSTGKQIVAYVRMFDQRMPITEVERKVLPGQEVHVEAIVRGYIVYDPHREYWALTALGIELLKRLRGDYTPHPKSSNRFDWLIRKLKRR